MKDMLLRACLFGLVAALRPAPAQACSTLSPPWGLAMGTPGAGEALRTAPGGVIALSATIAGVLIEEALAQPRLTLTRADEVIEATPSFVPLQLERGSGPRPIYLGVVVWRPAAPLAPGATYTAKVERAGEYGGVLSFAVEVDAEPLPSLPAPEISAVVGTRVAVEDRAVVCCERGPDSCGDTSECLPTVQLFHPAIGVEATSPGAWAGNALVWLAPALPEGGLGPRAQAVPTWWRLEPWSFLALTPETVATFAAAQDSYCVVVGATSLLDGAEVVSQPRCVAAAEIGAPAEEPHPALEFFSDEYFATCDSPPVYDDGRLYGAEAERGGCRMGQVESPWVLLALLPVLRRRRRR